MADSLWKAGIAFEWERHQDLWRDHVILWVYRKP